MRVGKIYFLSKREKLRNASSVAYSKYASHNVANVEPMFYYFELIASCPSSFSAYCSLTKTMLRFLFLFSLISMF